MLDVKGYSVGELLYTGRVCNVYKAIRNADQQNFVLKVCHVEQPSLQELTLLQHEYQILKQLDSPYIIKAYDLINHHNKPILVLEDMNGKSLTRYLSKKPIALDEFFAIALQVAEAIKEIHRFSIIHKDIKPDNIIVDASTLTAKLEDFSFSSQLAQESQDLIHVQFLEGTLAYMSPEQTGRMNRSIDYRTDFYSLGVTFFEMLTGQLPFYAKDPLELIYDHLATVPRQVHELNQTIPEVVSAIVAKLLSKIPEDRYTSAVGIIDDLKKCQEEWLRQGTIQSFALGQQDIYDRLIISQKLYGRESQVASLLESFEMVSKGSKEIIFVSGYSGIGKTSLVKEIYRPITRQHGYFVSGKYDELQRSSPYSALIEAFEELIHRILSEPAEVLDSLRLRLQKALGDAGQIIVELVPSLALIIGPQAPLKSLPPQESHNRFIFTFQNFVRVLAQREHPLVLFLDDLQWIDGASLLLLRYILTDGELGHLLIIGTYRDNEVTVDHPLAVFQQELKKVKKPLLPIALSPLSQNDVQHLLADSLNCQTEKVEELAQLLLRKTQGNPYFINEILKKLYRDQILIFSFEKRQWAWEISRIQQENITDNVVDLLLDRINELSPQARNTLKLASCTGYTFNLHDLAIISKRSPLEIARDLWEAAENTLIRSIGKNSHLAERLGLADALSLTDNIIYSFSHDRIHQSAYQLVTSAERAQLHLTIGRLLVKNTPLQEGGEKLFEILDHFNQALELIDNDAEKNQIIEANLWAGKKAKASSAYKIAANYLQSGISLLPHSCWQTHYPVSFALYRELAESELFLSHDKQAKSHLNLLLDKAQSSRDKVELYKLQAFIWLSRSNNGEGVLSYLQALLRLGVRLPRYPSTLQILTSLVKIKLTTGFRNLEDITLTKTLDPDIENISDIVEKTLKPAFALDQNFFAHILFTAIRLSLQHGYSSGTPALYLGFGTILIHKLKLVEQGNAYVSIAEKIPEKITPTSYFALGIFIGPWRQPLDSCRNYFLKGHQESLNVGDLSTGLDCIVCYTTTTYSAGRPLEEVMVGIERKSAFCDRFNIKDPFILTSACKVTTESLINGLARHQDEIDDLVKRIDSNEHKTDSANVLVFFTGLFYIMGEYQQSLHFGMEYKKYAEYNSGIFSDLEGTFYYAMTLSAMHPDAELKDKRPILKKLEVLHKQFIWWAKLCPANAARYERLVAAEIASIKEDRAAAEDFYHQSILAAEETECLHVLAIANECAGRFFLRLKNTHIAKTYLQKAHYAYTRWGAIAKVRIIEATYPEFFQPTQEAAFPTVTQNTPSLSTGTAMASIDVLTLLKSTQVISSEILLKPLLQKLLVILLQNAGAQRGAVLMKEGEDWYVKAEGTTKFQQITTDLEEPVEKRLDIPLTLINYAQRIKEKVLIQDTKDFEPYLDKDAYLNNARPQSVLVLPIPYQGQVRSLLYLENQTTSRAFLPESLYTLELLASQVSISLENARLYHQATHDSLTGLANRNLLYQMFSHAASQAKRNGKSVAIFFMDLDKFKLVNDTLGHEVGDKVLLHFSDHLKTYLRDSDLAVRMGGDEFVLLLENMPDKGQVTEVATRILSSFNEPLIINGHEISIGASIGISLYPQDGSDIHDLLKLADTALYQVKESGRGQYLFYEPGQKENAESFDQRNAVDENL